MSINQHFEHYEIGKVANDCIVFEPTTTNPFMLSLKFHKFNDHLLNDNIIIFGIPNKLVWKNLDDDFYRDYCFLKENKQTFAQPFFYFKNYWGNNRFACIKHRRLEFLFYSRLIAIDIFENLSNITIWEFIKSFPNQTNDEYCENYKKRYCSN